MILCGGVVCIVLLSTFGKVMKKIKSFQQQFLKCVATTTIFTVAPSVLFFVLANPVHATVISSSTFDTDSEGWSVADWDGNLTHIVGTYPVTYNASGGNPGGYISSTDPSSNNFLFAAPAKFLGNQTAAYGGSLQLDTFDQNQPTVSSFLVLLTGAGLRLASPVVNPPDTSWTSYTVSLTPSGWGIIGSGVQPTVTQMQTVLGSLDGLYIQGDWHFGSDFSGLDNVILNAGVPENAAVPEPTSTLSLLALGTLGTASTLKRKLKSSKSTEKEKTKVG
jgi:hypothetical protein